MFCWLTGHNFSIPTGGMCPNATNIVRKRCSNFNCSATNC